MKNIRYKIEKIYVNTKSRFVEKLILCLLIFKIIPIIRNKDFSTYLKSFVDFQYQEYILEKYLF